MALELSANNKEAENLRFKQYLLTLPGIDVDAIVHSLNDTISRHIDCTACGNCCKSLMINVTEPEADVLAAHLQQTREGFDSQYLEKGSSMMVINAIPCAFLNENKCTVYEHRFSGCKEFPAMHLPHFNKRLFTTFMHYNRCPIIYNVVEALKLETNFEK
ncbi:YkgJ family cysteine cluster protein [Parasediminibacterium sp. JCM 36343]|uniref:YkgJ family cysteine cluster protein n=1 Tax=Parasediminibacterium sp. JCM 36343 TaxID=3374279 RepID=UPI00397E777C